MAKILVADDNSNIQKMVGLALKDQGIDVVAVGNGEAAVRKISDVKPDLVLADVFMPVRNGYEVCQYVKEDPALAHIPVILLVGAFDPLDEQEAQRVGADGVLKKPFVPPDPLISMVKSALARAGVSLGPKEPEPAPVKVEPFKPLALHTPPPPPIVEETPIEEIPVRTAPISIDRGAQPLAFGNLLETTPAEDEQDVAELVSPVRMERDWKSASEDEEMDVEEEAEVSGPSWRPGATDLDDDETPAGKKDWREAAFANIPESAQKPAYSVAEVEEPAAELVGAEQNSSVVPSAYSNGNSWSSSKTGSVPSPEAIVMPDIISVTPVEESVPVEASAPVSAPEPTSAAAPAEVSAPANNSWMSVAPSPWDAEVAKANKLAATWDTAVAVATEPTPVSAGSILAAPDVAPDPTPEQVAAALPTSAVEEIREEATHVVEEAAPEVPQPAPAAQATAAPELNVDEMVAKVLSKMDPSVLQAMTKELLKPVIESIVREELNKK